MIPESFHFLRPAWLLALVPAALLLWAAARSARDASPWRRLVDEHLLRHLLIVDGDRNGAWPIALLGFAWLAACVALAGPTWEQIPQPTYTSRTPTVIALEMSPAMDVADPAPSRLMHARHKIQDILDQTRGGQTALVLYSGDAFVASPLTDDGRVIGEMVPSLVPGLMPGAESRPERAIAEANKLLDQAGVPGGQIVLIAATPGDDPAAARAAAEATKARGRRFTVLGVGTSEGAPLVDARGRMVKGSDGKPMISRLDESGLAALANAGGGGLTHAAADGSDVRGLIASPIAESDTHDRERTSTQTDTWRDAGVYLIAIPALLAPLAFRRGWLVALTLGVLLGGAPPSAEASTWQDLWKTHDQQGQAALATGQAADAAALFDNPDWKAAAQYQGGNFAEAAKSYEKLQGSENRYNLGNALAKAGQLEPAIKAYDQALAEQPNHEDAKFNRDLVKRLLDEQKKQQQQSQKQNQSGGGQGDQKNDQSQSGQGGQNSQGAQDKSGQNQSDAQNQSGEAQKDQKNGGSQSASSTDAQKNSGADGQSADPKDQAQPKDQQQTAAASGDQQDKSGSNAEQKSAAQEAQQSPDKGDQDQRQAAAESADASPHKPQKGAAGGSAEQKPETGDKHSGGGAQNAGDDQAEPQPRPRNADAKEEQGSGESLAEKMNRALSESPEQTAQNTATGAGDAHQKPTSEQDQAREQMLRQVPDDPAGLLRARIRRHFAENSISQREGGSSW